MDNQGLLRVVNLKKTFPVSTGLFARGATLLKAVDTVSFSLTRGETFGLVGESGCGKTTIARLILCLDTPDSGQIFFKEKNIFGFDTAARKRFRQKVQIIFQDPFSSLNPRKKVGSIIGEPLLIHKLIPKKDVKDRVRALLDLVGLQQDHFDRYPHEFSSGQRQRIGIARALSLNPELIVADEPVSALDVSIQAQILNLLIDLQGKMNFTYLFISHDLSVVELISLRVAVMYLGKIVETGLKDELFTSALHPYTEALLSAVPVPDPAHRKTRIMLQGEVPGPLNPPRGCIFSSRCPIVNKDICLHKHPSLEEKRAGHWAACFLR